MADKKSEFNQISQQAEKSPIIPKKTKLADLQSLSKEDLVDRIRQLEFHVNQLKNVIAKGNGEKSGRPKPPQRPFNWSKHNKRHVALKIAYLGWDYKGFVVQEDSNNTIEHALFDALITARLIESRETSNYHRCGRTDKGVSAFCQVISIDLRSTQSTGLGVILSPNAGVSDKPEIDYAGILNRILPDEIRVLAWSPVEADFSARFNCKQRSYKYFFPRGDLDVGLMNAASQKLIGTHDFRNLCKMDVGNGVVNFMRTVDSAIVTVDDETADDGGYSMCTFSIVSKAFLWHQIRCVMALVFMVGKKQEKPEIIDELFDVETNPCKPQYTMASELPLNLFDCSYDELEWIYDSAEVEKVVAHYQQQWSQHAVKITMIRAMIGNLVSHVPVSKNCQADIILSDYRRHTEYRPLLTRTTCSSLEDRKEYFAKRRKLDKCLNSEEDDNKTTGKEIE